MTDSKEVAALKTALANALFDADTIRDTLTHAQALNTKLTEENRALKEAEKKMPLPRPEILEFALRMEYQMQQHDRLNGTNTLVSSDKHELVDKFNKASQELSLLCFAGRIMHDNSVERLAKAALDIANLAMLIHSNKDKY